MPATLDALEARKKDTYSHLVDSEHDCFEFDQKLTWLEGQLKEIYAMALKESRKDISVSEIAQLWGKMVEICDFFIDHVRAMESQSPCPASYDELLDIRIASNEKLEFHRCC